MRELDHPDGITRLLQFAGLIVLIGSASISVSCGLGERKLQEFRKRTIMDANRVVIAIKNEKGHWPTEGAQLYADERWHRDLRLVRYRRIPSGGYRLWIQREDLEAEQPDTDGFYVSPEREPRDGDVYAAFASNGDLVACSWTIPEWGGASVKPKPTSEADQVCRAKVRQSSR